MRFWGFGNWWCMHGWMEFLEVEGLWESCGLAWRVTAVTPQITRKESLSLPVGDVLFYYVHSHFFRENLGRVHSVWDISNHKCITDGCMVNQYAGNSDCGCVAVMLSIKATVLMEHMCVSGIICSGLLWYGNVCGLIRPTPFCHHMSPLIPFW